MNLPEYKSLALPDTESGRREVISSHNLAEVILREAIDETCFCGIVVAQKEKDIFYLIDPHKYKTLTKNEKIPKEEAKQFRYGVLSRLMLRVDREGKQERTNRILALSR